MTTRDPYSELVELTDEQVDELAGAAQANAAAEPLDIGIPIFI